MIFIYFLIGAWCLTVLWSGGHDYMELRKEQAQYKDDAREQLEILQKITAVEREIELASSNKEYQTALIHKTLGFIKDGEKIFLPNDYPATNEHKQ